MNRLTLFLSPVKHNLLAFGLFLFAWYLSSLFFEAYIIPSPVTVILESRTLFNEDFIGHTLKTFSRLSWGFSVSLFLGTSIGACTFVLRIKNLMETVMVLFQVLPGLVLGIVFLIAFGTGSVVPILLIIFLSTPLIAVNTANALKKNDMKLENVIRSFDGNTYHMIRDLYLPKLVPTIRANATLGLVMSVKIVLLGEFLATENGIGYLLNVARIYFNMQDVFFYILIILIFIVLCQIFFSLLFATCFQKFLYPE